MAPAVPTYAPRDPGHTVLYKVIAEHLETFLASCHDDPEATGLPVYVQPEFDDYLRGCAAPGSTALRCTPTRRFRRSGGINGHSSSALRPAGPCRWSASSTTPTGSTSTPSPIHGRTAPRAFASHRWNSWRSWRRGAPCPTSIWCAMAAVERRTATCVGQSSQPHVSQASTRRRCAPRRRAGAGRGCSSAALAWTWRTARGVRAGPCGSSPSSRRLK
jgi:hypothetical protein